MSPNSARALGILVPLAVKVTRGSVTTLGRWWTRFTGYRAPMCHWHMSRAHHPTLSRSRDLACTHALSIDHGALSATAGDMIEARSSVRAEVTMQRFLALMDAKRYVTTISSCGSPREVARKHLKSHACSRSRTRSVEHEQTSPFVDKDIHATLHIAVRARRLHS